MTEREYKYKWDTLYVRCTQCWERLTTNCFFKKKTGKFWIKSMCKKCCRKYVDWWYSKNREKHLEYCKLYHEINRDKLNLKKEKHNNDFREKVWFDWSAFHWRARSHVKRYKLKPDICPICGNVWNVIIHHPSYETYDKRSEVVFCCATCHSKIHKWAIECPNPVNLLELSASLKHQG